MTSPEIDFSDDILAYLRQRRGHLVTTMTLVGDLTRRVKDRSESRRVRGKLLSCVARLVSEKKIVRYRKTTMVKRKPRSAQGLIRISEVWA